MQHSPFFPTVWLPLLTSALLVGCVNGRDGNEKTDTAISVDTASRESDGNAQSSDTGSNQSLSEKHVDEYNALTKKLNERREQFAGDIADRTQRLSHPTQQELLD